MVRTTDLVVASKQVVLYSKEYKFYRKEVNIS
nr:MAG TPA: hypothetical protein [Caudoviricetes sp.]